MNKLSKALYTALSLLWYPFIIRSIKTSKSDVVFFFPYYHTGGGEQVHSDIIEAVRDRPTLCIITGMSVNTDMKTEFSTNSNVITLLRWGTKRGFSEYMGRRIASVLNSKKVKTVFSSNSFFFRYVIPHLDSDICKIDLIHTYLGDREDGFEQQTLSYVHLLSKRVVLGEKQKQLTAGFYQDQGLSPQLADRLVVIPNKVKLVEKNASRKYPTDALNVLFVGRNAPEKRAELFLQIAAKCNAMNLPVSFIMIGDFDEFSKRVTPNLELPGRIKEQEDLNAYYSKSHLILITSEFEGFPMVLLEGMSLGVVPISTRVGEVPFHINEESGTGFIIENDQSDQEIVDAFVKKLIYLSENQSLLKNYSENVRKLVRERFCEERFNQAYRSLLLNE